MTKVEIESPKVKKDNGMLRLKKSEEFSRVIRKGRSVADQSLVLYLYVNKEGKRRIGFSVGKKIGKAVERNYYKRVLRDIVRRHESHIKAGYDLILIARPAIKEKNYVQIETSFLTLLKKSSLWNDQSMV